MEKIVAQAKTEPKKINREEFLRVIGRRVKHFRRQKKWTQEKLAQEAHINDKYVYDIEVGNKCMSIWVLEKLANALEIDVANLLRD